jgi:hypothetical protein
VAFKTEWEDMELTGGITIDLSNEDQSIKAPSEVDTLLDEIAELKQREYTTPDEEEPFGYTEEDSVIYDKDGEPLYKTD